MKNTLKFLLTTQLKHFHSNKRVSGFTLVELLIALMLAFLVITPLMAFMISIMNSDRQEQAKATSEQELQTAIDYISRDLQQAVYIYDNDGLSKLNDSDPKKSGIKNQIPPGSGDTGACTSTTCTPILVFWKRKFISDGITLSSSTVKDTKDDTFVYSLVAYYIIKDSNTTWSSAARIARFEVSDGIQGGSNTCGTDYPNQNYVSCPDQGFKRFDLNLVGATGIKEKMNSWKKASKNYIGTPVVLIDFIDKTSIGSNTLACTSPKLVSSTYMGFYSCIDTDNTTAQIFLRGNALARLQKNDIAYQASIQNYFPTGSVRVQGRGYLYTK